VALLGGGELVSVTEAAMRDGANVAVVGNEIIQFANATPLGAGVYRLDTLLRGRLGTEHACAGHVHGERFVLLDGAVEALTTTPTQLGVSWPLRAVTLGASLDVGTEQTHVVQAESLKPYSPVHLAARRMAGSTIRLQWVRRARIDGAWRSGVDIPLMEQREEYDVRIMSGSTVKRQWRTIQPWVDYSLAEQTADFGGAQTSISLQVAQVSALVGLGRVASANVVVQ
jgi:hypothetical protein